jgi:hypothetical protein
MHAMLRPCAVAFSVAFVLVAADARAYRPFDGTDGDVAKAGEVEIELGPAGYLAEGQTHALHAPAFVFNYGFYRRFELVLEGHGRELLDTGVDGPRVRFQDGGAFIKSVLREGVLQDKTGLSVATEVGPLLPETGDPRAGASGALIVSDRWSGGTVHFNVAAIYTRLHDPGAFLGVILEGPYESTIRPVAEVFVEGDTSVDWVASGLVGAIWRLDEDVTLDLGLRVGRGKDRDIGEVRLGFTWAFPVLEM